MQAGRIVETCLYVDDLEAAETFYSDVLGLTPFSRVEERHVFFRCAESVFLLFNPDKTSVAAGNVPPHGAYGPGHVAFAMRRGDISAWRERLQEYDVPIESEISWPSGGYSLYFRDPAGNSVELTMPQTWEY